MKLRTIRLADLGWTLGPGRRVHSRVTVGAAGRVDFLESLSPRQALRNAQYALCGNDVVTYGQPFGAAVTR